MAIVPMILSFSKWTRLESISLALLMEDVSGVKGQNLKGCMLHACFKIVHCGVADLLCTTSSLRLFTTVFGCEARVQEV